MSGNMKVNLPKSWGAPDTWSKQFGKAMATKLQMRLNSLSAAESLGTFWPPNSRPERCHELKGKRVGEFSMDLMQPHRLIFEPTDKELKKRHENGDERSRWNAIRDIDVTGIEDTHG